MRFDAAEDFKLPFEAEKEVYRIVQEALNNVLKHAQARAIAITLEHRANMVVVQVEDDGIGFDTQENKYGMGLPGMRERVELLQGKIEITSTPNQGTRVCIQVPVGQAKGEVL